MGMCRSPSELGELADAAREVVGRSVEEHRFDRRHRDGTDIAVDGNRYEDSLAFAVQVAGITCSRPGADPPWAAELTHPGDPGAGS